MRIIRHLNALRAGDETATGQKLEHSAGLSACLDALRPHWRRAQDEVAAFNAKNGPTRQGVGCTTTATHFRSGF